MKLATVASHLATLKVGIICHHILWNIVALWSMMGTLLH